MRASCFVQARRAPSRSAGATANSGCGDPMGRAPFATGSKENDCWDVATRSLTMSLAALGVKGGATVRNRPPTQVPRYARDDTRRTSSRRSLQQRAWLFPTPHGVLLRRVVAR